MSHIHATAIIDPSAIISPKATIGPFCIVGPNVTIGDGTVLMPNAQIEKNTIIGKNNTIHPLAIIGGAAQDYDVDGGETYLEIGDGNIFRENVTIHRGTKENTKTVIGNNNFFMVGSHVAHNCTIGNHVIIVNNTAIGGYVTLEDNCILSGNSSVHQFCRVGRFAMLSANSYISKDLPPFIVASGRNNPNLGINRIGLRRNKTDRQVISELTKLYKLFFCSNLNIKNGIKKIEEELTQFPEIKEFIDFIASSKKGVLNANKDIKNS